MRSSNGQEDYLKRRLLGDGLHLERLLFNLNTLTELGEEMTSAREFSRVVKSALFMVMGSLGASKGSILKYDADKKSFTPVAAKGLEAISDFSLTLDENAMTRLAFVQRPVDLRGVDTEILSLLGPGRERLFKLDARLVVFLSVKDELLGLITINEKFNGEPFTDFDLQFFSVMAQQIAFSLHSHSLLVKLMHKYSENKGLYDNLSRIYYDTIHSFAAAIDAKDAYTKGHSHRVSAYAAVLAREMGWPKEEIEGIRIAGLLHDIGKIAIDKTIINKATTLTKHEYRELNSHPVVGYEILSKIKFPWRNIALYSRTHHEKLDGSGYPDGLGRGEIALGAKMLSLVDAFDAMTTDRPYRPRLTFREAIIEVKQCLNKQFDPEAIHPFVDVLKKEIMGEVERPTIVPLLHEQLNQSEVTDILAGFDV